MEDYLLCTELDDENEMNNSGQKAIFLQKYLWNKNTPITIGFLENGDDIERKQINNDQKNVDPLQFQIQNSSLNPLCDDKSSTCDSVLYRCKPNGYHECTSDHSCTIFAYEGCYKEDDAKTHQSYCQV